MDKLLDLACVVNNTFLLNKFVFTDACASELFYHANCLKRLGNEYTKESKVANEGSSQAWIKALAYNKVVDHILDCNAESPGVIFNLKQLKNMYIDQLESNGIYITTHVTIFSTGLTNSVDDLIAKSVERSMLTVCIDETVSSLYWEHQ